MGSLPRGVRIRVTRGVTACLDAWTLPRRVAAPWSLAVLGSLADLTMCPNSLDATVAGRYRVEAWSAWVPRGHGTWTSPHTVTHGNLSPGAHRCS